MLGFAIAGLQIEPNMLWDGLVGAIGGGAVSSVITIVSERRSKRTEVALDILEKFMSQYEALATVLGLLDAPQSLADPENMNRVRKMGDWYEIVAAVCLENRAELPLLRRLTIPTLMNQFLVRARTAAPSNPNLRTAVDSWTNLRDYLAKEHL